MDSCFRKKNSHKVQSFQRSRPLFQRNITYSLSFFHKNLSHKQILEIFLQKFATQVIVYNFLFPNFLLSSCIIKFEEGPVKDKKLYLQRIHCRICIFDGRIQSQLLFKKKIKRCLSLSINFTNKENFPPPFIS